MEETTMRGLAKELGVANGALAVYFPSKHAILAAAFAHIFSATSIRFERERAHGLRGAQALRAFLVELFPLDEERLFEARIAILFLEYAAHKAVMGELHASSMSIWAREPTSLLSEMIEDAEAADDLDFQVFIDHVLAVSLGVQASGILVPDSASPTRLKATIESVLKTAL